MSLASDFRSALRSLSRSRGTTALAIATLAIGLGASTAMFSAIDGILLRPLPYSEPERIVRLTPRVIDNGFDQISWPNFEDIQSWSTSLESVAALTNSGMFVFVGEEPELLEGLDATHQIFEVLGTEAALGRTYGPEDDRTGAPDVMLISWEWWQERFGGDRSILGRSISTSPTGATSRTVIGVMPRGFKFPITAERVDYYAPLRPQVDEETRTARNSVWLDTVARIAEGRSVADADAELATISSRLEQVDLVANRDLRMRPIPIGDEFFGKTRRALWVLFAAVGAVLLIACANVASLFLGRAAARGREMAVRTALGASRFRIVRQLLVESMMIGLAAGVAGLALASASIQVLLALAPADIPRLDAVSLDWRVFLFGMTVAAATGILFGLAPAITAASPKIGESLRDGSRGATEGRGKGRMREALVITEIALALLLLPAAGVLLRSFWNLTNVNIGFDPQNVTLLDLSLRSSRYETDEQIIEAARTLRDRLEALPGVESVATSRLLPFFQSNRVLDIMILGRPAPEPGRGISPAAEIVSPGYFSTLRIPILRGREFTEADSASSQPVLIISETFVRRHFPHEDPLGARISMGSKEMEVVGIAADIRESDVMREPMEAMYEPFAQAVTRRVRFLVRSSPGSSLSPQTLRDVVRGMDRLQPVVEIRPLAEFRTDAFAARRLGLTLILSLAGLAFVLAAVGIYSVMSHTVSRRTTEIGVRMAFGAEKSDILKLVLRRVALLAGAGGVIGILGALIGTRLIGRFLYGVAPEDPLTFLAILVLLSVIALAAGWMPARRAARVDPIRAIRYE